MNNRKHTVRLTGYMPDGTAVDRKFYADEKAEMRELMARMVVVNLQSLVVVYR